MSIKKKFLFLLLMTLLATLGISFFAYEKLKNEIMSVTGSLFLKKQVQFNRERVLHPLIRELALAQKMTTSPILLDWAENENDPEKKQKGIAELESFRRFFADKSYFFALKSSGNYYFNDAQNSFAGKQLRYRLNPEIEEDRWFFATLESGDDYRLNVDYDEKLGVTKVWINVVIKKDDKTLGIAGSGIDLTEFINKVIGSNQPGITNILIDHDGAIQAYTKLDWIDYRSISKGAEKRKTIYSMLNSGKDQELFAAAMKECNKDQSAIPVFFGEIDGRRHLIGLTYIKEIDWYNVSILDIGKVLGKNHFVPFAGLLIFALVIFAALIYFLLNKFVFDRIERLDKSVRGFAKGVVPDYPKNPANDEVGNLEAGFKKMVRVVKENTDNLELRVIERTKELEIKNKDLKTATEEIKVLSGLLPICAHCKNIRDDDGYWHKVENYVGKHTSATFSHGICPECMEKHYKHIKKKKKTRDV